MIFSGDQVTGAVGASATTISSLFLESGCSNVVTISGAEALTLTYADGTTIVLQGLSSTQIADLTQSFGNAGRGTGNFDVASSTITTFS